MSLCVSLSLSYSSVVESLLSSICFKESTSRSCSVLDTFSLRILLRKEVMLISYENAAGFP